MKNILIIIILAITSIGCVNNKSEKKEKFEDVLFETSNALNKRCPMIIDANTTLQNTVVLSDNTLQYNYRFDFLIDKNDIKSIKSEMHKNLFNQYSTDPKMKIFRENNVTMRYNYIDKNNEFTFVIIVKPEEFNRSKN